MNTAAGIEATSMGSGDRPDWPQRRLGDLTSAIASGTTRRFTSFGQFPVHGSTGVIGWSNEADYEGEAILIARVGANAGALRQVSGAYGVSDNTIIVRVKEGISLAYVRRQLEAKRLNTLIFGSGQPLITGSQIKDLSISLPARAEQDAVSGVLADVDALLAKLDQLIAKKRDLKQAAMQRLLPGRVRLQGFNGQWEDRSLATLGPLLKGRGIRRDQANSGSIACVRYGEIYTTHHDIVRAITSRISPAVAATATRLKRGDILFAGSGETKEEIGKCVALIDDFDAYAGGDIVILRPRGVDSRFLGYALNTPEVNRQKANFGQGDAVVHISAAALGSVTVRLPPLDEQGAIGTVLTDMDAELAALETRRDKTRQLKQGMMQGLLTGRIRLT